MMHQQSPDKLLNAKDFFSVVKTSLQNVLYKSVLIDTGQRANNDLINEFPELEKNLKSHFSIKEHFNIAYQTQFSMKSNILELNANSNTRVNSSAPDLRQKQHRTI